MQRIAAQPTFTDPMLADLGGPKATAFFDRCLKEIPFDDLAESVADVFVENRPDGGAPHRPVLTLLKIMFLQKCFNLSDPMAEEMLRDRISFRRFVDLSFDDDTPDHSTLSVFRKRLNEQGHGATLFDKTLEPEFGIKKMKKCLRMILSRRARRHGGAEKKIPDEFSTLLGASEKP